MTVVWLQRDIVLPEIAVSAPEIEVHNLYFSRDTENRVWVGLSVKKSSEVVSYYDMVARAAGQVPDAGNYFPHVTLGCVTSGAALDLLSLNSFAEAATERKLSGHRLHVCENGEFGKVIEVLA
jgi:hypothetical protein